MDHFKEMTPEISQQWLDICTGIALETARIENKVDAVCIIQFSVGNDIRAIKSLGLLLQWACEDPDGFKSTFECILPDPRQLCPFHHDGLNSIIHLVNNGIMDDWDVYAKLTSEGYVIVGENDRAPEYQRFDLKWAPDWLWGRAGGARTPNSEFLELYAHAIGLSINPFERPT